MCARRQLGAYAGVYVFIVVGTYAGMISDTRIRRNCTHTWYTPEELSAERPSVCVCLCVCVAEGLIH